MAQAKEGCSTCVSKPIRIHAERKNSVTTEGLPYGKAALSRYASVRRVRTTRVSE